MKNPLQASLKHLGQRAAWGQSLSSTDQPSRTELSYLGKERDSGSTLTSHIFQQD